MAQHRLRVIVDGTVTGGIVVFDRTSNIRGDLWSIAEALIVTLFSWMAAFADFGDHRGLD